MSALDFKAASYQQFSWADLLARHFRGELVRVLGSRQYCIIPEVLAPEPVWTVITQQNTIDCKSADMTPVENNFLHQCGLAVYAYKNLEMISPIKPLSSRYVLLCQAILLDLLMQVEQIIVYIHQHLSNRDSDQVPITSHQTIKVKFAAVDCCLCSAKALLTEHNDLMPLSVAAEDIHQALHHLAELGGGRSILRGNTLEILFHLQLFRSLFLTAEGV